MYTNNKLFDYLIQTVVIIIYFDCLEQNGVPSSELRLNILTNKKEIYCGQLVSLRYVQVFIVFIIYCLNYTGLLESHSQPNHGTR